MTKSTWRNIYNFDASTTESNFDINDIVSSVSATSDLEGVIRQNIDMIEGGNQVSNLQTTPLVFLLENQKGGSNEVDISTEQLESKLRSIFTNAELKGSGDNEDEPHIHNDNCGHNGCGNTTGGNCENDEDGNPIPHMKGGSNDHIPLIFAEQYSDANSIIHKISTSNNNSDDSSSSSESDLATSNVSSSQVNLIAATQYSDASSFGSH